VHAQNLIPNSGFEEIFTASDHQWVQPQGPFYHYEVTDVSTAHAAFQGKFVNGICMYNNEPNEYLHVKLLEPLEAGQLYKLSVQAILMRAKCFKAEEQRYIGVHFGDNRLDTHIPGDFGLIPQLNLELPRGNRFSWFQLADTFRAAGGEQYMTVGYFPETQKHESMAKAQEAFFEEIELRNKAKEANENKKNMSWLYMSPEDQKKYLKEQKKKKKTGEPSNDSNTDRPLMGKKDEMNSMETAFQAFFSVRYYFDEFCLSAIVDGQKSNCASEETPEEIAVGRTINLRNVFFDTDKATLLDESIIQLTALKNLLDEFSKMRIEIRGYTDSQGDDAYNLDLSQRRAGAVVEWLVTQGIDMSRLQSMGFGETQNVATNETEAGRALNRRVTFYILSM
jgi:outer membrane protein OmpA-like peptidoglycan-associated protein